MDRAAFGSIALKESGLQGNFLEVAGNARPKVKAFDFELPREIDPSLQVGLKLSISFSRFCLGRQFSPDLQRKSDFAGNFHLD